MPFSCLGVCASAELLIWRSFTHGDLKAYRLCYCLGCLNSYVELRWIMYWDWNYLCFIWIRLLVAFCTLASCSFFMTLVDLSTQEFTKSVFWGKAASSESMQFLTACAVALTWACSQGSFLQLGEWVVEVRSESVGWINAWQLNWVGGSWSLNLAGKRIS